MHHNAMLNMISQQKARIKPKCKKQPERDWHSSAHAFHLIVEHLVVHISTLYLPHDFASIPSGGRVSTLPLLTSSQFVLNEVPLLSV
jgi:hypothetical protein